MDRYSFCVLKRGAKKFTISKNKHSLAFLDYFAMQFKNKKDLIQFLSGRPNAYEDIAISYVSNGKNKIIPIYFDAIQLEEIVKEMVQVPFEVTDHFQFLALAYKKVIKPTVINEVPDLKVVSRLLSQIKRDNLIQIAAMSGYLHKRAQDFYDNFDYDLFDQEIRRSYLSIRKIYTFLRNNGIIHGESREKPMFINNFQDYNNKTLSLEDYSNKEYDILLKMLQELIQKEGKNEIAELLENNSIDMVICRIQEELIMSFKEIHDQKLVKKILEVISLIQYREYILSKLVAGDYDSFMNVSDQTEIEKAQQFVKRLKKDKTFIDK